ncbi:MAG TPA: ABC transporter ATP-binding protein [Candidatus Magasanikbacteria bacterium]|nr:ABC transporter ATP-binding protein [Candidatus Magasanikbacteria bacterium]
MNYDLNKPNTTDKSSAWQAAKKLWPLIAAEKNIIIMALVAVIANSILNLTAPRLIAHTVDTFIVQRDYHGVLVYSGIILSLYLLGLVTSYVQIRLMGGVGQRVLYRLRNQIFNKLQSLPIAFFNQNKAGDLISRINNDTDKINQFFSQSLVQFFGSIFLMTGSAIFLLSLNIRLGLATLSPAVVLLFITLGLSAWVKKKNLTSAESLGGMSSEIQESLNNFKVIIAFNRRDYFKKRFQEVNNTNYSAAVEAGVANNTFTPIYGLASNIGQLIVLAYGISLISSGHFTIGLLISFLSYANNFYNPLRQLAALWANFQSALASWQRVHEILVMENNLPVITDATASDTESVLEFKDVNFTYPDGKPVLHSVNLNLEKGKTYALVGPTGGGKTTTASLMARLYDPTTGQVFLHGKDIRSYSPEERTRKIGFILQEPLLFTGTVRENILYGNEEFSSLGNAQLEGIIHESGLEGLLKRFDQGLETKLTASGDAVSLGQKQLIAFMRAVLRNPELLILDEATANIDTVTEQLLEDILRNLPASTTKVIIAHRLNTIENADEIFFVNGGEVIRAGSMDHAIEMLLHHNRKS